MNFQCDKCGRPATIHLTEIVGGRKIEKHLCEDCAAEEGITVKSNVPISQLLEDFVLQTASTQPESGVSSQSDAPDLTCEACGMKFAEFRENGLLGCPNDYDAFADALEPLLEDAQDGHTQHIGKVPRNAGRSQKRQNELLRLRAELKSAVAAEDYERAAELRDRITELEQQ
ncbi:MAG: UvrB/UvrC motif-containing protein [Phycisphaerae bacterium]